jgi:hypothetical protein
MMKNIKFIFWGFVTALGALAMEMALAVFFPGEMLAIFDRITFLIFLFVAIEELFKLAVIFRSVSAAAFFRPSFLIGSGFALTEIFLAYSKNAATAGPDLFLLLAGVGILHIVTSIICGFSAFYYKKNDSLALPSIAFFLALILHLVYNIAIINLINN